MKGILVCVFLVSVVYGAGWTVLGRLSDSFQLSESGKYENGNCYFKFIEKVAEGSFLRVVDAEGNYTPADREQYTFPVPAGTDSYTAVPFPVDIENPCTFAGVTKISASGDTLWTVMLDSLEEREDIPVSIIPCTQGGCFAVFPPDCDFLWEVYRLSDSGDVLMQGEFRLQGGPVIGVSDVVETADSSFLISGTTDDLGMNIFAFLVGIDSSGRQFIELKEDLRFHAGARSIELDRDGNIYLAGYTGYERDDGFFMPPWDSDVFLMKLDPAGNELRCTVFSFPRENRPLAMEVAENGDVLVLIRSFDYQFNGTEDSLTLLRYGE
ncbi:MAG: hypothetical protein J7K88_10880 [Candidatus Fermentibacteraceae bacterium]|nr:hypothetical protein [Candidatus Fermentibacteraceae bacterium]